MLILVCKLTDKSWNHFESLALQASSIYFTAHLEFLVFMSSGETLKITDI